MTIAKDKIRVIFCMADDFRHVYASFIKINGLAPKRDKSKRRYHREGTLSDAEVITMMILFHLCEYKGLAQRGQCSIGWFYGFKLHLICNEKGDLLNFMVTPGNVDDREPLRNKSFIEQIFGKLVGDKGYICKDLFSKLFVDGIQLITKLKNNMKGQIMTISYKILLRKRALIETINDEFKNMAPIEHSRHRSVVVPLTRTPAPRSGSPLASTTFPVILVPWASAATAIRIVTRNRKILFFIR